MTQASLIPSQASLIPSCQSVNRITNLKVR